MNGAARLPLVDGLKVVAAQAIVWHHIAFYGPMSDHAAALAPALFDALARHARIAVQIFLVVGGYLAARQLAPEGRWPGGAAAGPLIGRRYLRLVAPYATMLVLAVLAAAVARAWITHDSIPAAPTLTQLFAHLLLLQDLLGIDALSAGVWYVAIDFQLYVLLVGVLLLAARLSPWAAPWMVAALVALSLLAVNRDARWDVAAPYFFGAYGCARGVAPAQRALAAVGGGRAGSDRARGRMAQPHRAGRRHGARAGLVGRAWRGESRAGLLGRPQLRAVPDPLPHAAARQCRLHALGAAHSGRADGRHAAGVACEPGSGGVVPPRV
jgi:peptidoglycan/LPS O-acetylase OafA/YrhL